MMLTLSQRPELTEWMDNLDVAPAALAENLRDLRRLNVLLGWTRSVVQAVAQVVRRERLREFRLLDVATGSADIPLAISHWAHRHGLRAYVVASDIHPTMLMVAAEYRRGADLALVRHNALLAPFKPGSFHIATCNLSLHHFPPQQAAILLRELGRVAEHVIVTDLRRSRAAYWSALVLASLLRHKLTRHDAPISVLRSYTGEELRALAAEAGLEATVRPLFPFRMLLCGHAWRRGDE